jgi:hypothetical protein
VFPSAAGTTRSVRYKYAVQTPSTSQVRQWARDQGVPVGERGRLSPDLVAQYLAAHGAAGSRPAAKPSPPAARPSGVKLARTVSAKPRWDWNR